MQGHLIVKSPVVLNLLPFFFSWGLRIGVVCKGHIYSAVYKHDNTTDFTAVQIGFDRHTYTHMHAKTAFFKIA